MEIDILYVALLIIMMIYIIPTLAIRIGVNRRKLDRRLKNRRVSYVHIPIERRESEHDRRVENRRG